MSRRDLTFESARSFKDVVLNKHVVAFSDGAIPVGTESKELLCVGNRGKKDVKVQFFSKKADDVSSVLQNRPS